MRIVTLVDLAGLLKEGVAFNSSLFWAENLF